MTNEKNSGIELRNEIPLSFQTALLGEVTSDLRGVSVDWNENHISGIFIFDGKLTEEQEEMVFEVETEVIAHFSNHTIGLVAVGSRSTQRLDKFFSGVWVYRRAE